MDPVPSMAEVLENLRTQIAHHREQEALHGEREAFHREQRAAHVAELEQLTRHLAAFEAAVSTAADLATRKLPSEPARRFGQRSRFSINTAVFQVVSGKAPHEPFGPGAVTAEVNRRFQESLGRAVEERQVSVALRFLAAGGHIVLLEKGGSHRGARYARARPPAPA
jgi:hypothetical protein